MEKLLLILFTFTALLSAETRYLIVNGDHVKPIPARLSNKATHTVELTAEQMKVSGSPNDWKVVNGQPVLKTVQEKQAAVTAKKAEHATKEAQKLAEDLKTVFIVQNEGEKHPFNEQSQRLFLAQVMAKETDIRIRCVGKKSIKIDKARAGRIFAEISAYMNSVEDALEADLDAIAAGTFTLSNLNTVKVAQDALKN